MVTSPGSGSPTLMALLLYQRGTNGTMVTSPGSGSPTLKRGSASIARRKLQRARAHREALGRLAESRLVAE